MVRIQNAGRDEQSNRGTPIRTDELAAEMEETLPFHRVQDTFGANTAPSCSLSRRTMSSRLTRQKFPMDSDSVEGYSHRCPPAELVFENPGMMNRCCFLFRICWRSIHCLLNGKQKRRNSILSDCSRPEKLYRAATTRECVPCRMSVKRPQRPGWVRDGRYPVRTCWPESKLRDLVNDSATCTK